MKIILYEYALFSSNRLPVSELVSLVTQLIMFLHIHFHYIHNLFFKEVSSVDKITNGCFSFLLTLCAPTVIISHSSLCHTIFLSFVVALE